MNEDLRELLESLKSHSVEFLVIGAHAVGYYVRPRMTEDVELWVGRGKENAERLRIALDEFGAPIGVEGALDFSGPDKQMIRLGVPPNMVDILNFAGSKPFEEVWKNRQQGLLSDIAVEFPSREDLIEMKQVSGRPQDLADIERLRYHENTRQALGPEP